MKYGEVQRGSIDFRVDKLTPDLADEVGVSSTQGALVTRMLRNSASYEAGLRPGDVIVAFNGQKIDDVSHLNRLVADAKIGSTATLKIVRGGRTLDMKIPIVSTKTSRPRR
jgi:serine protease Do